MAWAAQKHLVVCPFNSSLIGSHGALVERTGHPLLIVQWQMRSKVQMRSIIELYSYFFASVLCCDDPPFRSFPLIVFVLSESVVDVVDFALVVLS